MHVFRFRVAGHGQGTPGVAIEKAAQSGYQDLLNPAVDHLAVQLFFRRPAGYHLLRGKPVAEEMADDVVIALPVHPFQHCAAGLQPIEKIETHPGLAMNRIGIHQDPIHIENQRQARGQAVPERRLYRLVHC